jgi:hypothetical protein
MECNVSFLILASTLVVIAAIRRLLELHRGTWKEPAGATGCKQWKLLIQRVLPVIVCK